MTKLPVTAVVPVRNEAARLPACLATLADFAEIVVVDSSSTDATQAVAREFGATVLDFDWQGGFPKKRNWCLRTHRFTTRWVLFLDADERVTPAFVAELRDALRNRQMSGYWLRYDNHFAGRRLRFGVPQRKLALFRVGAGEYERIDEDRWSRLDMEVHEHPVIDGEIGEIGAPLVHDDYRGLHHHIAKHNEYSSWEARRLAGLSRYHRGSLTFRQRMKYRFVASWWFPVAYFLFNYVVKLGFLDGRPGLTHSLFKAAYFFQVYVKFREARAAPIEAGGA